MVAWALGGVKRSVNCFTGSQQCKLSAELDWNSSVCRGEPPVNPGVVKVYESRTPRVVDKSVATLASVALSRYNLCGTAAIELAERPAERNGKDDWRGQRMRLRIIIITSLMIAVLVTLSGPDVSGAQSMLKSDPGVGNLPIKQIMIKFDSASANAALRSGNMEAILADVSEAAGEPLTYVRPMSGGAHVLALAAKKPPVEVAAISQRLTTLPAVAYAAPDLIKGIDRAATSPTAAPNLIPNDPRYAEQWHYRYTPGTSEGLNLPLAWSISTGSPGTVVAVIDTGILNHPDLAGRTVPGYDFIVDPFIANDGNGRDGDPSDPGDWVSFNECGFPISYDSTWHGTHVAGTIGAKSNNGLGVAGVNWKAKILPVRALGKCGGMTSDIVDAVRWSAGLPVTGAPTNLNPADVINLSLGGPGACTAFEQAAFDEVVAVGATVVIAAGNDNSNAASFSPANCENIITVAATERGGNRANYSNYGTIVEVSAPGGETGFIKTNGVLSTLNDGETTPGNHIYDYYQGTSMATPHVAGLASLLLSLDPTLKPNQILALLQDNARSFPDGSTCATSLCGAGIVDAYASMRALQPLNLNPGAYLPYIDSAPGATGIRNGDFEAGRTVWAEYSSHNYINILEAANLPVIPHSGQWATWLGWGYDEIGYIEQTVTIPFGEPYLTYWHWIESEDYGCGWDYAVIYISGGGVADLYNLCVDENTHGWVKHWVDLSYYAGQTVALQIRVETDGVFRSSLLVDDVAFSASAAQASDVMQPELGGSRPGIGRQAVERIQRANPRS